MSTNLTKTTERLIDISKVALVVIQAAAAGYKFYKENKDRYNDYFQSILKYMDAMEFSGSNLSGLEKKEFVMAKAKEIAIDLFSNWNHIAEITAKLINDAKEIYNIVTGKSLEIKFMLGELEG